MICYGADCLKGHHSVVLNAKSVCCAGDDCIEDYQEFKYGSGGMPGTDEKIHIPFEESSFFGFHSKMNIKDMRAVFRLNAPTRAKVVNFGNDFFSNCI